MTILRAVALSFSFFSKIPMPRVEWTNEHMKYIACGFPLVGIVIGIALYAWLMLCYTLNFGHILFAAGITLIPVFINGGIHLDGYCDTVDALSSNAEKEKKIKILDDPNTGAFAVIYTCLYMIMYFAFCTELEITTTTIFFLIGIHILIRTTSGFCMMQLNPSKKNGLFTLMHTSMNKKVTSFCLALFFILAMSIFIKLYYIFAIIALFILVAFVKYIDYMSNKNFGGMSGDLLGFLLQTLELIFIIALVITQKVA